MLFLRVLFCRCSSCGAKRSCRCRLDYKQNMLTSCKNRGSLIKYNLMPNPGLTPRRFSNCHICFVYTIIDLLDKPLSHTKYVSPRRPALPPPWHCTCLQFIVVVHTVGFSIPTARRFLTNMTAVDVLEFNVQFLSASKMLL